jgi:hypothetical protein
MYMKPMYVSDSYFRTFLFICLCVFPSFLRNVLNLRHRICTLETAQISELIGNNIYLKIYPTINTVDKFEFHMGNVTFNV